MNDILSKPYTLEACVNVIKTWATLQAMTGVNSDKLGQKMSPETEEPLQSDEFCEKVTEIEALAALDVASVAHLRRPRPGGEPLYCRLVALYRSGSEKSMQELDEALRSGELAAAAGVCHKLKSSTASLGAVSFAEELKVLEQLCLDENSEQAVKTYARLVKAYPAVLTAIEALNAKDAA